MFRLLRNISSLLFDHTKKDIWMQILHKNSKSEEIKEGDNEDLNLAEEALNECDVLTAYDDIALDMNINEITYSYDDESILVTDISEWHGIGSRSTIKISKDASKYKFDVDSAVTLSLDGCSSSDASKSALNTSTSDTFTLALQRH